MSTWKTRGLVLVLAGGLSAAAAGAAVAQTQPTPPSSETLAKCAAIGDEQERLACFDTAMKAAGYGPKPEAVTEARHKHFGLSAPKIAALKPHPKHKKPKEQQVETAEGRPAETEKNINVTLAKSTLVGDGKLLLVTNDGQIWEQTDSDRGIELPADGYVMSIRREIFGGYFCDVSAYKSVRCTRLR